MGRMIRCNGFGATAYYANTFLSLLPCHVSSCSTAYGTGPASTPTTVSTRMRTTVRPTLHWSKCKTINQGAQSFGHSGTNFLSILFTMSHSSLLGWRARRSFARRGRAKTASGNCHCNRQPNRASLNTFWRQRAHLHDASLTSLSSCWSCFSTVSPESLISSFKTCGSFLRTLHGRGGSKRGEPGNEPRRGISIPI